MLSDAEKRAIDREAEHLPRRRAAVIEALRVVQRHRRWVDDDAIADVAAHLGMDRTEVDSVATFYNLIFRRPVGRHVVFLCTSVTCWMLGCDRIREAFEEHAGIGLGETTEDERFTLLPIQCLGACDRAPVLMVDEETHREVGPDDVERLLGEAGQ